MTTKTDMLNAALPDAWFVMALACAEQSDAAQIECRAKLERCHTIRGYLEVFQLEYDTDEDDIADNGYEHDEIAGDENPPDLEHE
jgi:hypothetical protein